MSATRWRPLAPVQTHARHDQSARRGAAESSLAFPVALLPRPSTAPAPTASSGSGLAWPGRRSRRRGQYQRAWAGSWAGSLARPHDFVRFVGLPSPCKAPGTQRKRASKVKSKLDPRHQTPAQNTLGVGGVPAALAEPDGWPGMLTTGCSPSTLPTGARRAARRRCRSARQSSASALPPRAHVVWE